MARVKRGPHRKQKRQRTLKLAKGYFGKKKNAYRIARQAVERALRFSYRDRRQKKREFRKLWIVRINAASRENGLSYNRLISGLRKSGLELDRKVLADIAVHDAEGFAAIVEVAKEALEEAAEAGVKIRAETEKGRRPARPETKEAAPAQAKPKPKAKSKPKEEKEAEAEEKPAKKAEPKKKAPEKKKEAAKPESKPGAEKPKPAEKPAPKKAAEAEDPTTKKELEALTVAELEELAETRGIDKGDIEGSGASGNVVKADWVRALSGK